MKATASTILALIATPALADPGHFAASHGHSHWIAAGALALAAAIGVAALWRGRRARRENRAERRA